MAEPPSAGGFHDTVAELLPGVTVRVGADGAVAALARVTALVAVTTPEKPVPRLGSALVLPPYSTT